VSGPKKKPTTANTGVPEEVEKVSVPVSEIQALQGNVLILGLRISELSKSLNAVNQVQLAQIPREEHEERWREEQQALIKLRLQIKRRTYIVGATFFIASLLALGGTTWLVADQQQAANARLKQSCVDRVAISVKSVKAYDGLLTSPTIEHDGALSAFITTARDAAQRGTEVKC